MLQRLYTSEHDRQWTKSRPGPVAGGFPAPMDKVAALIELTS
jgi:hypothetical protein